MERVGALGPGYDHATEVAVRRMRYVDKHAVADAREVCVHGTQQWRRVIR